jgi:predicted DNA-binding transcriptional regulator AlpA
MIEPTLETLKATVHLTTEEVANRYQISEIMVKRWRTNGGGPRFLKIGRRVVYPLSELEAWEKTQLRRNTSD